MFMHDYGRLERHIIAFNFSLYTKSFRFYCEWKFWYRHTIQFPWLYY